MSWNLVGEIVDVLGRPKIRRYGVTDDDVDELVSLLGPLLPRLVVDVPIRDEDAPVVATAIAGRTEAIITGDRDRLLKATHVGRVMRPRHDHLARRHDRAPLRLSRALAKMVAGLTPHHPCDRWCGLDRGLHAAAQGAYAGSVCETHRRVRSGGLT